MAVPPASLLPAALLCLLVPAATASAGNEPTRCDRSTSIPATIEAIQSSYDEWAGKCVRLRGVRFDWRLYASREAILDEIEIYGAPALRSLVIYPERRGLRGQAQRVEVTGRVGSCQTAHEIIRALQEQESDNIVMVSGYCHTSLEHYVRLEQIKVLDRSRVVRLTEAEVSPAKRPLIDVPAAIAVPQAHLEAARQLVAAIGSQDEDEYLKLTRPISREFRHRDDIDEARAELSDDELVAQFRILKNLKGHEEKIFIDRTELADVAYRKSKAATQLTVCWCKSRNCRGRWPVGAFDTDNDPSRPYLCVRTGDWLVGPGQGSVVQAEAVPQTYYSRRARGLAEPDWRSGSAK